MPSESVGQAAALPPVTLAVKTYRQEATVREAVESAFAQTYPNLEILLSDDASPDGTYEILQRMAAAYRGPHRVVLNRNPENLGVVGHENRLWTMATGRLFAHAAGDDVAEPERIARLVEAWLAATGQGDSAPSEEGRARPDRTGAGGALLVHSAMRRIDDAGRSLGVERPDARILGDPSPLEMLQARTNHVGATALQDRRLFQVFGPIPDDCGVEDGVQFFRALLLGRVVYVDEPLVRYRVGGLSDPRQGEVSPGWQYIRGHRMKSIAWRSANAASFIRDMGRVDLPEKEACLAFCEAEIAKHAFELALWRASPPGRLALLPEALRLSRAGGGLRPMRLALRHLIGPLWIFWYDLRRRRGTAEPPL